MPLRRLTDDGTAVADTLHFTWEDTRLAEQSTPDGVHTTWDYTPGTHRPLTQTNRDLGTSRFHAVITDLVGTPTELVTPDGHLARQTRATLWGTPLPAPPSATDCPLRFPGQYADPETGLYCNYFRHYDPETARYATPDPLGLSPGPNHYTYVTNALLWTGPLGLQACGAPDQISQNIADHALESAKRPDGNGTHFVRGVDDKALAHYVDGVINGNVPNVVPRYDLRNGRVGYWDPDKRAVVIEDGDGGTVFTPKGGKDWFDNELE